MSKLLVISGHPDLNQSLSNRIIVDALKTSFGTTVDIRRLDVLYPDFKMDIATEQEALLAAEVIVWQFPMHWYNLPALMKKWLDDVFVYGFSHGSATRLAGKKLIISFTTGAPEQAYQVGEAMNYPIQDFLPPLRQTALLCRLDWQAPIYSHGMTYIPGVHSEADKARVEAKARAQAERLITTIRELGVQPEVV